MRVRQHHVVLTLRTSVSLLTLVLFCADGCTPRDAAAVKTLMQSPIAPASDALFNSVIYTNGQLVAAPRTDADWRRVGERAAALAAVASPLKALAPRNGGDVWERQSDLFAEGAKAATAAVAAKDVDALLSAGGELYASCEACHAGFIKDEGGNRR